MFNVESFRMLTKIKTKSPRQQKIREINIII
jgi:hypothetical protein